MKKNNNKSAFLIVFRYLLIVYIGLFSAVVFSQISTESVMDENKTINAVTNKKIEAIQHENTLKNVSPQTPLFKQKPHQLSNYGASITEMFFYLFLVVGLIFALAWVVKKIGYNNVSQTQLMKVTACLPLSTKEKLMVVQIGDEQIVIGVAPGFVGHITSLKQPLAMNESLPVAGHQGFSASFSSLFQRVVTGQSGYDNKSEKHDEK